MIVSQKWFQDKIPARRAVLITGGFDPLHYGHIRYLKAAIGRAKEHGLQLVVVGVAPDAYIARKHPLFQVLAERMEMMDAVAGVDFVLPQDEESAALVIRAVRPAVFLKGDDWLKRGLPQAELDAVAEVGGTVGYVPVHDVSSSDRLREFAWRFMDEMAGRA